MFSCDQSYEKKMWAKKLFLYRLEAVSENLVAVDYVDKGVGVDVVNLLLEMSELTSRNCGINKIAFLAVVHSYALHASTATLEVVDNHLTNFLILVAHDKYCLVALDTFYHNVDDLALDEDKDYGVDWQTEVAERKRSERNAAINDKHQSSKRNLGVLVQNHRDNVASARCCPRLEDQTDCKTINYTCHNCVKEIIWNEPASVVGDFHHVNPVDWSRHYRAIVDYRRITPEHFQQEGEEEYQYRRYNCLNSELRTENQRTYYK